MKKLISTLILTFLLIVAALWLVLPPPASSQGAGTAASIYRTTFANLGTPANGSVRYCTDCNANTSPCTSGGTGAFAGRVNGAWSCNVSASSVGGSGTTNTVPKFTSAAAIGNSSITDDGSLVQTTEQTRIAVTGAAPLLTLKDLSNSSFSQLGQISYRDSANAERLNIGLIGDGTGDAQIKLANDKTLRLFVNNADEFDITSSLVSTPLAFQAASAKFAISSNGLPTTTNNIGLVGQGFPLIVGLTSQKAETGADANVLTVTPASAVGTYRLRVSWTVTTASSAVIGWKATWKDAGGTSQAPTNLSMFQVGTAAPALTFTAGSGSAYYAEAQIDVDSSGTNIVIATTMGTGTLTTSKLTATIERLN